MTNRPRVDDLPEHVADLSDANRVRITGCHPSSLDGSLFFVICDSSFVIPSSLGMCARLIFRRNITTYNDRHRDVEGFVGLTVFRRVPRVRQSDKMNAESVENRRERREEHIARMSSLRVSAVLCVLCVNSSLPSPSRLA